MALQLCVLASGSSGNCTYIGAPGMGMLIDAGLSGKETLRRLDAVKVAPDGIEAVCLTHEHSDHRSGLGILQRKLGLRIYANTGTVEAVERDPKLQGLSWSIFATGSPFQVGEFHVQPFSVPHDSYDPVGFCVRHGDACVGVVSDMGVATSAIRERLRQCQILVIESNHDEDMLRDADRPWSLKQRIMGRQGHLSNTQAGELVADLAGPHLQTVFLAHLSGDCNTPELAMKTVRRVLEKRGITHVDVKLTYSDRVSDVAQASA
jgi:phosphoribosyl 1,2-cyclic phosphodiesterase